MKRKSSGVTAYVITGIIVVSAGLAAGYYFTGSHGAPNSLTGTISAPPPASPTEAAPNPAPVTPRQIANAGKYTAPGAPPVTIDEIKSSPVPEKKQTDPEQSQTGAPAASPPPAETTITTPATVPAPTTSPEPSNTDSAPTTPPSGDATPVPPSPVAPTAAATSDASTETTSAASGSALYCVEAGTFSNEKNAKSLVDDLRTLSFDAAVVPADSTNTSFRVQVGAYRTKATADAAVASLQRQGYPAYILTK